MCEPYEKNHVTDVCWYVSKESSLSKNKSAYQKSAYPKINFLISQPKHMLWVLKRTSQLDSSFEHPQHMFIVSQQKPMLWVLKRTVSMRRDGSFEHPKHMLKPMGKKIFMVLRSEILFILTCANKDN